MAKASMLEQLFLWWMTALIHQGQALYKTSSINAGA
jgi:hypothetical protein